MSTILTARFIFLLLAVVPLVKAEPAFVKRDGNVLDNFDGLYFGQFGNSAIPPDISGGVGKAGILQVVNTHAAYFPKTGTESREAFWNISLEGAASAFPTSVFTFDPRAWYDPVADRFMMIILDIKNTAPKKSWLHMAVSKTGHPIGMPDPANAGKRLFDPNEWHRYRYDLTRTGGSFSPTAPGGADYPTLAVDRRAVYVTVNYFDIADAGGNRKFEGGIDESGVFVFDKNPLYAGTGAVADGGAAPANAPFTYFPSSTDGSLQPAMPWQNPESPLLPNDAWFISLDQDAVDTFIDTYYLGYTPGGLTRDDDQTAHDDVIIADPMPQPGGVLPLDNHGDRMLSAARHLGTMFGVFVGDYDNGGEHYPVIRLANMNPEAGETILLQQTNFGRGNQPAIAAGPERMCLAYTRSSVTENPSIVVKMLSRINGTAELTANSESLLLRSATPYNGTGRSGQDFARWGDYAHVSTDPLNHTFWICQQYARGAGVNEWGTRWFNVTASQFGLTEVVEEIHLITASDPIPRFGTLLPQGGVGTPVRTIKIAQGDSILLKVGIEERSPGVPNTNTVRWYKDGALLQSGSSHQVPINSVNLTHQGIYHINVENDVNELTISEEIFLDVVVPPVAVMNKSRLNLTRLTQGYLEVILDPVLRPEMDTLNYAWTPSTTQPRILGGRVQLLPGVTTPTIAAQVDGLWTCTVSNLAGSTMVSADVVAGPRVLSGPILPASPQVGLAPVEISITATGALGAGPQTQRPDFPGFENAPWFQDDPSGVLSVVWRKDGVPIPLGGRFTATGNTSTLEKGLVISNPDYEDEGIYDCVVTDVWGEARAVISPPRQLILSPLAPPYLTLVQSQGPEPRTSAAMVYDSRRKKTVLFGGEAFGINPRSTFTTPQHFTSNDTWEWDGKTWVRRNPAHRPPPTSAHGMVYDSLRGRTVLFGGRKDVPPNFTPGTEVTTNDVWEWDGTDWTQITPPTPVLARLSPVMCFDSVRGEVLMLGGTSFNPERQDIPGFHEIRKTLWGWNGSQWTNRGILPNGTAAPTISNGNAFAFDPGRGVAVLFGLFDDTQYPVWEWNGTAWNRIVPPFPRVAESRFSGSAFYDPVRHQVGLPIVSNSLFPNTVNNVAGMVWWDGASFIKGDNLTIDGISGTTLNGVEGMPYGQGQDLGVFDTDRRCFVWHDTPQFVNSGLAHTREQHFSAKAKFVHQPLEVVFENSKTIKFRAISAGLQPIAYQWFKNDVLLNDNTHYSGSNTATLTITGTTAADVGAYTLRAINTMSQAVSPAILLTPQPDGISVAVQGHAMILSWAGSGILESSTSLGGAWTAVTGAISPQAVALDEPRRFYRVGGP